MTEAEIEFIEQMGLISQNGGSPRISGRIFGLLIIRGKALTLNEIAETLQISKASASTNARQLRDHGVLKLTSKPGVRQDFYELMPNPFQGMLEKMSDMMAQAAKAIGECQDGLQTSPDDVQRRVASLQQFYQHSAFYMAETAKNLTPFDQGPQNTATATGQESDHD